MIAIVEACGANFASLQWALTRLGKKAILTRDPQRIQAARQVILPGVGTARQAMLELLKAKLLTVLAELRQPVLGICVGMQILYEYSAEGETPGLGVLPGQVQALPAFPGLRVPHMGWNRLQMMKPSSPLLQGISENDYLYYVHSYAALPCQQTTAETQHGSAFSAVVEKDNFFGVQFHPEKSGKAGEKILKNFLALG